MSGVTTEEISVGGDVAESENTEMGATTVLTEVGDHAAEPFILFEAWCPRSRPVSEEIKRY